MKPKNFASQFWAAVFFALGLFALTAQLALIINITHDSGGAYLPAVIRFFSFMTIWTNILLTLVFACPLFFPSSKLTRWLQAPLAAGGIFVYALVVMLVYHFVLAPIWNPTGLQKVVDICLHYAMPSGYLLYWFLFSLPGRLKFGFPLRWLLYPLVYSWYALLRGALVQEYPYPFIDLTIISKAALLQNMALICLAYLLLGYLLVGADRLRASAKTAG